MIVINKDLCPQNHACPVIKVCPVKAITQNHYEAPSVQNDTCICCCKCVRRCQVFVAIGCCDKGEDPRML